MEKSEFNMIIQAIRELSDKIDGVETRLNQRIDGLEQRMDSLEQRMDSLEEKVDKNHGVVTGKIDRLTEKVEYIQEKMIDHDEDIFRLKKRVL
ncbi:MULTISPECIES: hemagglutinin [Allobacillus]|uniref:Hemagglutinin n=1 Tax=Allobacillus salarius TaxID=1955272 RepID=A0A556PGP5_9BACI|nr:hemagglutinin [Allobacillus salarius]TSJ63576.1 hemagglutinin [Allobacillus salarius]